MGVKGNSILILTPHSQLHTQLDLHTTSYETRFEHIFQYLKAIHYIEAVNL
jgi:hypothetical protein